MPPTRILLFKAKNWILLCYCNPATHKCFHITVRPKMFQEQSRIVWAAPEEYTCITFATDRIPWSIWIPSDYSANQGGTTDGSLTSLNPGTEWRETFSMWLDWTPRLSGLSIASYPKASFEKTTCQNLCRKALDGNLLARSLVKSRWRGLRRERIRPNLVISFLPFTNIPFLHRIAEKETWAVTSTSPCSPVPLTSKKTFTPGLRTDALRSFSTLAV